MSLSNARVLALLLGATALWIATSACQIGDGSCLRMSDCDTGYRCVEGTCISDRPSDAPNVAPSSNDGSAPPVTTSSPVGASSSDASSTPAPDGGDAASSDSGPTGDGGATLDGGATDAAPDV